MKLRLLIEIEADSAMVEQVHAMVADGHVVALDPAPVKRDRITGTVVGAVPVGHDRSIHVSIGSRLTPGLLGL